MQHQQVLLYYKWSLDITSLRRINRRYFTTQHQQILLYYATSSGITLLWSSGITVLQTIINTTLQFL
jgi:hypothetical protein